MNQVKQMMAAGVSLATAVKEILARREPSMTLSAFADNHDRPVTTISNLINGKLVPTDADIAAFVAEFGGEPDEWRMLFWEQMRPVISAA